VEEVGGRLCDVAAYRPNDTDGERDRHPEDDRERDLRHVTTPVVVQHPFPSGRHVDPVQPRRCRPEKRDSGGESERRSDGSGGVVQQRPEGDAAETQHYRHRQFRVDHPDASRFLEVVMLQPPGL
jgi:hypothetical protein